MSILVSLFFDGDLICFFVQHDRLFAQLFRSCKVNSLLFRLRCLTFYFNFLDYQGHARGNYSKMFSRNNYNVSHQCHGSRIRQSQSISDVLRLFPEAFFVDARWATSSSGWWLYTINCKRCLKDVNLLLYWVASRSPVLTLVITSMEIS